MTYWDASFPLAMLISQLFLRQSCLLKERDSDTSLFAASCLFVIDSLHAPAVCKAFQCAVSEIAAGVSFTSLTLLSQKGSGTAHFGIPRLPHTVKHFNG